MEIRDIVQEAVFKTIPKKKKCKKAKWLSEEALEIAVKEKMRKAREKRKDILIRMQSSRGKNTAVIKNLCCICQYKQIDQ